MSSSYLTTPPQLQQHWLLYLSQLLGWLTDATIDVCYSTYAGILCKEELTLLPHLLISINTYLWLLFWQVLCNRSIPLVIQMIGLFQLAPVCSGQPIFRVPTCFLEQLHCSLILCCPCPVLITPQQNMGFRTNTCMFFTRPCDHRAKKCGCVCTCAHMRVISVSVCTYKTKLSSYQYLQIPTHFSKLPPSMLINTSSCQALHSHCL